MEQVLPNKLIWKTYGVWAIWIGIAFFTIYPSCNWLTSLRESTYPLYLEQELNLPFLPEFIWLYLSMYVLFILPPFFLDTVQLKRLGIQLLSGTIVSGLIFLIFPSQLGFERTIPDNAFYGSLYAQMFSIDLPHNMVPSLHVVFSALILLSIFDVEKRTWLKALWIGWLALICLSTILVHQHHLLDVVSGLLLSWFVRFTIRRNSSYA